MGIKDTTLTLSDKLKAAVQLMLISQVVMVAAILVQYFISLTLAPFIAVALYLGLLITERRVGITSPVTVIIAFLYVVLASTSYITDDKSWMAYSSLIIYLTLSTLIFCLLIYGKPFTGFYSSGYTFVPLHIRISIIWGVLFGLAGLTGYFLMPDIMFLYIPLGLMIIGSVATLWLNFISVGPDYERKTSFELNNFYFREARNSEDLETFYQVVAKSYRPDLQKMLGISHRISESMIICEHQTSDRKRGTMQAPFIAFEGNLAVGSISIFFDHPKHGLPIEGEANLDLARWRNKGTVAEIGRLGLIKTHRFNPMALKGLLKCVVEMAAEKRVHYLFNDSFFFQVSLYEKIGFSKLTNDPYVSSDKNSTGYGLKVMPMIMNLANIVRLDNNTNTTDDVKSILAPYVMERYFKHLVLKETFQSLASMKLNLRRTR